MKGLPIGYSKDLQEDKEALFDAEDTLLGSVGATGAVLGGLTLRREAAEAAASGLLLATDVADYLVGKGLPFRDAHETVGALVRRLVRERSVVRIADARGVAPALGAVRGRRDDVDFGCGVGRTEADAAVDPPRRRLAPRWPSCAPGSATSLRDTNFLPGKKLSVRFQNRIVRPTDPRQNRKLLSATSNSSSGSLSSSDRK